MSDTDNDDLKRAIALSLGENSPTTSGRGIQLIDLTSDDEDDDLDAPVSTKQMTSANPKIQAGDNKSRYMAPGSQKPDTTTPSRPAVPDHINSSPYANKTAPLMPGTSLTSPDFLSRKKMEEERLLSVSLRKKREEMSAARDELKKRKASTSPPLRRQDGRQVEHNFSASRAELELAAVKETVVRNPIPKITEYSSRIDFLNLTQLKQDRSAPIPISTTAKRTKSNSNPSLEESNMSEIVSYTQQRTLSAPGIQFPEGVVKKTWVYGCPRQGDDIKIEEVFQKEDLELAVLSAHQVEPDWVISKLSPSTKVTWVLQAKDEWQKQNWRSEAPKNFRFCFPNMQGIINCMHSKLCLLAHPKYLRIVVPSANLVPYDWGESGVMENICFLIDLPRLPEGKVEDPELTHFGKELLHFVTNMGLDNGVIESMRRFDFRNTAHLAFVHSIGGSHSQPDVWMRTGYPGLGKAIQNLGLQTEEALTVDFVTASVGSLNDSLLKALVLAAQGDSGLMEYGWRTNRSARSKVGAETVAERTLLDDLKNGFRIYFPTEKTVARSKGGIGAGGTICLQSKFYDSESFPRSLMRDCKSRREGVLMHSKMMFVQLANEAHRGVAWAYVGSANLSESAWGRLVKDKTTKEPKLNCRNWECGVVLPIPADLSTEARQSRNEGFGGLASRGMEVFRDHIPVPMVVPGEEYGHDHRPWFYSEQGGNSES